MKYICGCERAEKRNYHVSVLRDGEQGVARRDEGGHEVCPEHGMRIEGWRSVAARETMKTSAKLELDTSAPDTRDTRDPQELGQAILAGRNGH